MAWSTLGVTGGEGVFALVCYFALANNDDVSNLKIKEGWVPDFYPYSATFGVFNLERTFLGGGSDHLSEYLL